MKISTRKLEAANFSLMGTLPSEDTNITCWKLSDRDGYPWLLRRDVRIHYPPQLSGEPPNPPVVATFIELRPITLERKYNAAKECEIISSYKETLVGIIVEDSVHGAAMTAKEALAELCRVAQPQPCKLKRGTLDDVFRLLQAATDLSQKDIKFFTAYGEKPAEIREAVGSASCSDSFMRDLITWFQPELGVSQGWRDGPWLSVDRAIFDIHPTAAPSSHRKVQALKMMRDFYRATRAQLNLTDQDVEARLQPYQ